MNLKTYLDKKPMYYKKIDYQRMPRVFNALKHSFKLPKTVQIVGTNGKGSTGRYLAKMLESAGFKVGHYTSPHVLEFNERFYIDGGLVPNEELEVLHVKLQKILGKYEEELSYFEYATFLAFLAFQNCDYMILEAGVGGEFDATNVVPKKISVVTSISLDHQDMLGNSINEIARTKFASVKNTAVVAPQEFSEVMEIAKETEQRSGFSFLYVDKNEKNESVEGYAKKNSLPDFLKQNLLTAFKASELLGVKADIDALPKLDLKGRCEKIAPNVTLDVGHNVGAAKTLARYFNGKKVVLVYNSYKDKDFKSILETLKPVIERIELIDIENDARADAKEEIRFLCADMGITCEDFCKINSVEEYLVFGSFSVAEIFLKSFNER